MKKALTSGADALILDLEDSVAPDAKSAAREHVSAFLDRRRDHAVRLLVRINPLESGEAERDLKAVVGGRPDAIMLPKAQGQDSIMAASALLSALGGSMPLLPIAAETPPALFTLGDYAKLSVHLFGITWGAEDLAVSLGAARSRDTAGALGEPLRVARAMVLFAAQAAGVPAIDTVFPDFRNTAALSRYATTSAADGFSGMLAIHPAQIPLINAAFTPDETAIGRARAIVQAFGDNPGNGALQIDGKMVDIPHLKQAMALLERAS
ncbi:Citryl-CoA lyase [Sphingobium indicum BiD32]|uniref:Citryl-CoA lyase n=2 Tax=Sphingobium indicum TaxID=332055 RepID=N1MP74_9SPHN|nr:Citryl-CoA lyase [Sphingobium indicum BiD32]